MIILGKDFLKNLSALMGSFNTPVVSLKEPGAADHSSVEWDVGFNLVLSMVGP